MALVPVPRPKLSRDLERAARLVAAAVPGSVVELVRTLSGGGHAAYVVGGSVRDTLLGRPARDWDLATSGRPAEVRALFSDTAYENAFGTVAVRVAGDVHEVTTFRIDHDYADFRRPHRVEFGESIDADLARRDFTINAMAWGLEGSEDVAAAHFVDPFGGLADLDARSLRAVGDPDARFGEDALRMVRAARLAAQLDLSIEPATRAAIERHAGLAGHLSGERIAAELTRLLEFDRPSIGLRLLAETGLLAVVLPELDAERGVSQNKVPGEDLWDHTLRSVDAVDPGRPIVRLAALLHDTGKPSTASDGHFYGHEVVGADIAEAVLRRLHVPRETWERVVHLVRAHMFLYDPSWGDGAVRRFIGKIGPDALDELFALREADNVGSGLSPDAGGLAELRARVTAELAGPIVLDRRDLAIDGTDLIEELGLEPGPELGRVLDALLERVVADPAFNTRPTLLLLARAVVGDDR